MIKRYALLALFLYVPQLFAADLNESSDTAACDLSLAIRAEDVNVAFDLLEDGIRPCEHTEHQISAISIFNFIDDMLLEQAAELLFGPDGLYQAETELGKAIKSAMTILDGEGRSFALHLARANLHLDLSQFLKVLLYESATPDVSTVFCKYGLWPLFPHLIKHLDYDNLIYLLYALSVADVPLEHQHLSQVFKKAASSPLNESEMLEIFASYFPFNKFKASWMELFSLNTFGTYSLKLHFLVNLYFENYEGSDPILLAQKQDLRVPNSPANSPLVINRLAQMIRLEEGIVPPGMLLMGGSFFLPPF